MRIHDATKKKYNAQFFHTSNTWRITVHGEQPRTAQNQITVMFSYREAQDLHDWLSTELGHGWQGNRKGVRKGHVRPLTQLSATDSDYDGLSAPFEGY